MNPQRSKILITAFYVSFLVIISRMFYWQIIKSSDSKEKSILQSYKLEKILPQRGKIYSSDGFPLTLNQSLYKLAIYKPNLNTDINTIIEQINQTVPGFKQKHSQLIANFITNQNQKWISFPDLLSSDVTEKIKNPGVSFEKINSRLYPENLLAKNILGSISQNNSNHSIGIGGLEAYYDKQLQGKTGFIWSPKDGTGQTILTKKSWEMEAIDGRDIHTSINRSVQYETETKLKQGIEEFSADSGSIIIMKPQTGEVIAMSSLIASGSATPSASRNVAIADLFEPGSIFKPLVMTMAFDKNSIDNNYICTKCNQPRVIGKYTINNWDFEVHPDSSLKDIIANSDNIGMSFIIDRLGLKNFLSYFQKLGLTQKTTIDLQGESRPILKEYWSDIDLATASFGQGFAVTQIQMIQAFNAIANDGVLVRPTVANYLEENGKIINPKKKEPIQIFQKGSVSNMKSILKYAVENSAVSSFKPKNMEVCAKSGTAQVAVKGGYTDSSTIGSYIGFSPCNNPKFTMIVTINNPKTSSWGSSTAAPIWFDLASSIYHLL